MTPECPSANLKKMCKLNKTRRLNRKCSQQFQSVLPWNMIQQSEFRWRALTIWKVHVSSFLPKKKGERIFEISRGLVSIVEKKFQKDFSPPFFFVSPLVTHLSNHYSDFSLHSLPPSPIIILISLSFSLFIAPLSNYYSHFSLFLHSLPQNKTSLKTQTKQNLSISREIWEHKKVSITRHCFWI